MVGLAYWLLGADPYLSGIWAVGYLLWVLPSWMEDVMLAMGVADPAGQVTSHDWSFVLVQDMDRGDAVGGVYIRAAVFLVPLLFGLVGYDLVVGLDDWNLASLLVPVTLFYPAYWLGFRLMPTNPAWVAETLVGASFGASMWLFQALS